MSIVHFHDKHTHTHTHTHAHTHTQGKTNTSARRLFLGSLVYLPLLLACMVFHRSGEAAAAPYHPVFK